MMQIFLLLVFVVPVAWFLFTQYSILHLIRPENRAIKPGLVWLQLIPFAGFLLQFYIIPKISESISRQLSVVDDESLLGIPAASPEETGERPTLIIGYAYCFLWVIAVAINIVTLYWAPGVNLLGPVLSLAGFVCWIIYWVKLNRCRKNIASQYVAFPGSGS